LVKSFAMLECLNNIIGVTTSENTCITQGLTIDQKAAIKLSTSGLFLDDLEGGVHLKAVTNADATKGFYNMASGAISGAVRRVEDDLIVALNNKYRKSKKNFEGTIGRMSFATSLNTSGDLQGLRLRASDYGDAVITISKINLIINQTETLILYVYKAPQGEAEGEIVTQYAVNATANAYATITPTEPLKLPLTDQGQMYDYYFIWSRTEANGALPKDTKIQCSTCNKTNGTGISEFIEAKGVQYTGTLGTFQGVTTDDYSHGLILDASIRCDNERLFCREFKDDDAVSVTMAWASLYKAGELLIEEVLKSPDVNRYTTMDRTYLWGKRNHFKKNYEDRITYLAAVIDVTASNCYVCREMSNQPFVAGIFI
jgi:hypothetical protein